MSGTALRQLHSKVGILKALTSSQIYPRACYHKLDTTSSATTVINLRSDTFTKPTPRMREAMKNAEVGDDVYGEDPTVNKLEELSAAMFGKEAAILVPSGTMANVIAVMIHGQKRFSEVVLGDQSHIHLYEVAGIASLGGIQGRCVPNLPDGTMDLSAIESKIRYHDDVHLPWTKLICLENTQNRCGGKVLSLDYMKKVKELADKHSVSLHLDGARVFNAAAALKVPVSEIAKPFDSISTAFSKGLCCPVGSLLFGSKDFIYIARRVRKALGGGMRQAGVIAAPMLVALEEMVDRLEEDHQRALYIAEAVTSLGDNPVCSVDLSGVHSNIVMIDIKDKMSAETFAQRMQQVTDEEVKSLGESLSVLVLPFSPTKLRYVTYNDIGDDCVKRVAKKFQYVISELSK